MHEPPYETVKALSLVLGVPVPFLYCEDEVMAELLLALGDADGTFRTHVIQAALTSLRDR